MIDKEEWTEVETVTSNNEENKVEFEVEEEKEKVEVQAKTEPEVQVEVETKAESEPVKEEAPKELDGIETKGAQKRIRHLIKQRKDRDDQISQLIQQNETLNTKLNTREQEFHNISKLNLDANEKQITDKLELARAAYASAHGDGDSEKIVKAQEFLNEAQTDLKTLNATRAQFKDIPQPQVQAQPQVQPQPQPQAQVDPLAVDWSQKPENKWFGKDRVMTAAALALDADLKEEGFDPNDPDFYTEIDNRLKESFPQKFETNRVQEQPSKPAQVVAGASRSTPSSNKVKLTKEDVRLAQNWGIPLEQYAAEKLKVENADGEYTAIKM